MRNASSSNEPLATRRLRAAEYVRMSTEAQEYSIAYQQKAIRCYAAERGIEIVRTYVDEGKSGLTVTGRSALLQLLADVEVPNKEFDRVLVFDISRWGRFQDVDESGYYEFHCRKHGVTIEYCAEAFVNNADPLTAVIKSIRRAMAAEYSRDLSIRVSATMRRMTSIGHFHGGAPGYGLRRMLIARDGSRFGILEAGVQKSIKSMRTILVPGPEDEVNTVREIFRLFVEEQKGHSAIARTLNKSGSRFRNGKRWEAQHIWRIIRSERYLGTIVFNRTHSLLGTEKRRVGVEKTDPSQWVRSPPCFSPLVSQQTFAAANAVPDLRGIVYRDEEALLRPLRRLLKKHGRLSEGLIVKARDAPSTPTYRRRFGSLHIAYARIGYSQPTDYKTLPINVQIKERRHEAVAALIRLLASNDIEAVWDARTHQIVVPSCAFHLGVAIARYSPTRYFRHPRWVVRVNYKEPGAAVVVMRMDQWNRDITDYFCIPNDSWPKFMFRLYPKLGNWSSYRCLDLETLVIRLVNMIPSNRST